VSLTAPADGATFQTSDSITISANATDDSAVAQVEFFANGVSLGVDTTAPYSVSTTLSAGTYSLTATATDNVGASTTSSPVSITVNAPNQPPRVVLTAPSPGAVFKTTDAITFSADAFDDGSVAKVEFFAGASLVGTDTTAPYGVTASLAAGTYSVYARATDDMGLTAGTDPITITVQAVTSSQPTVDSITQNASSVQMQVTATDGAALTLQASSDLVNWNPIDTTTATGGKATFTESMNGAMQFYRVVSQ
jgi:chitinase